MGGQYARLYFYISNKQVETTCVKYIGINLPKDMRNRHIGHYERVLRGLKKLYVKMCCVHRCDDSKLLRCHFFPN